MASSESTQPPPPLSTTDAEPAVPTESEPLLGRPGDAIQKPDAPMFLNLVLGTAWLSQLGALLLLVTTWSAVFLHKLGVLISPHPLLQSLGTFLLIQAILILQPTSTPAAKRTGQRIHASLHLLSFLSFISGITVIETNKHVNHNAHLHSLHGYLGVITGTLLFAQYMFGIGIWLVPGIFGGEEKAKALWKYHRYGGYLLLVLVLATIGAAADTDYSKGVLKIEGWTFGLGIALVVVGVFPRVQLRKLGIDRSR
ncbi:eukaryotic cytochrome b561-domain-containing protein [Pseudoneurospora amorphoporcata]|uniref:Eukaryotic cytochrome b561-domain-containing protein n=1 Tax=Pseudoneurospora amorphoporcata TaxID=241081 RepID=A0AAN6SCR5_9PEZI|nr:eukaryotic cytochrome b561-domain-containing protein [Pseudoneurospora amorphoporcata]